MDEYAGKRPLPAVATDAAGASRYLGLDLHKRQITFCVLDAEGNALRRGQIATTREAILAFARQELRPMDEVALEATTNSWAVVDLIEPHVARVVVSNPLNYIENRWRILIGLIALLIVDVLQLFIPRVIKYAIDDLTLGTRLVMGL